jgi:predicted 2-oxoglutarate/Fe(II)-dependent dioxygenase YbiX
VLIVRQFLSRAECGRLLEVAGGLRSEEAEISRLQEGDAELVRQRSARRVTTTIKTFDAPGVFTPVVARALRDHVDPFYGLRTEWFEWPDVLLYRPGGHYDIHTDADVRDPDTGRWRRVMDRDVSLLVYLNDDFSGGELEFPERGESIRPETGMLVAFPSDHRFAHAALPVEAGNRSVVVSWAAAFDSPRVMSGPRLHVVYPERAALPAGIPMKEIELAGFFLEPPPHKSR